MNFEKEIIDYEKNKEDIEHWMLLKGTFRYKKIIEFLKSQSITRSWENITNYIKYDKRILINSFKYIVFLEELFKSFIFKYKKLNANKLLRYDFSDAISEFIKLKGKAEYDGIDLNAMKEEKLTIIYYRNDVVHNKILIGKNFYNRSLEQTLNIYSKILPSSYRKGFVNDINDCANDLKLARGIILT